MKPIPELRQMVDTNHQQLSVVQQCILLSIHRSGIYYRPRGESMLNLELMLLMDEHYLEHPEKGARRIYIWLTEDKGYKISKNRVDRLYYKVMALRSIMPGPHTSKRNKEHKVFPYLLRGLEIEKPNQVWATDISYIPMKKGFLYLTAVIDIYSRYVINWSISNTMEASWCVEVINEAVRKHGKPEIINTDQGSQYTSEEFSEFVTKECEIKLSMDGKGRATDNAFIETLWKTVKYEKIYCNIQETGQELYHQLNEYFQYYNMERRHSKIGNKRPIEIFNAKLKAAA